MDLWVVATAAGAGYVAKASILKKFSSRSKESSQESFSCGCQSQSRSLLRQIRGRTCPLCRLAALKQTAAGGREVHFQSPGIHGRSDFFDISSETLKSLKSDIAEAGYFLTRGRQLRSRSNGYILDPLNSAKSCLNAEFEEEMCTSALSPCSHMLRPLTDGILIVGDSIDFRQDMQPETKIGSLVLTRKPKQSIGLGLSRGFTRSIESISAAQPSSQGFLNGLLLFFLGTMIGLLSVIVANKRDMDILIEMLKKNECLVQDLEEELEMKDVLTLKENANESSETPGNEEPFLCGTQIAFSAEELGRTPTCASKEAANQKAEKSEAMSKIEAELEAELERLEQNMKSSGLERILNFAEPQLHIEENVIQGNLRVDNLNAKPDNLSESEHDVSRTSSEHTYTGDYAVPPQELKLRLHEVIQSRLRARIIELEAALENSQKRLHALESGSIGLQRGLYCQAETSSTFLK